MSCSSCMHENPCGCKKKKSCDDCPVVDWVPNTACTIGVTMNGCTDTLELRPGIQNCETKTVFGQNPKTGCIEYQNELYVATDGQEGYIMSVCPVDIAKFINLEDLANVEDVQPENCSLLVYKAESDCGPGCTGVADTWVHWYASEHLTNGLHWVAGFNENGCLEALDVPPRTNEYWWGMYRPTDTGNGVEFGYVQPETVAELPKNDDGQTMVISKTSNGKPIYGPIDTTFSLCPGAVEFQARSSDSAPGAGYYWKDMTMDNTDDFLITPDDDTSWRAPCCGIMVVMYCVNIIGTVGSYEVDTTRMKSSDGAWTQAFEDANSTHSTWYTPGTANKGVSESCSAAALLAKGETIRLHARVAGAGSAATTETSFYNHKFRVHAVKAVFIPLEKE